MIKERRMIRKKRLALEEIFAPMDAGEQKIVIDGEIYSLKSQRLQLFHRDGTECVRCGRKGSFFSLESSSALERAHLNLYGVELNAKGQEQWILFTKDHIIPKSKGGKNTMNNYQVMCSPCNNKKGSTSEKDDLKRIAQSSRNALASA